MMAMGCGWKQPRGEALSAWQKRRSDLHTYAGARTRKLVCDPEADEESCGRGFSRRATKSNLFSIVLTVAASVLGRMDLQGRQWHVN